MQRLYDLTKEIAEHLTHALPGTFRAVDRMTGEGMDRWGCIDEQGTGRALLLFIERGVFARRRGVTITVSGVYPEAVDGSLYYPGYDMDRNQPRQTPQINVSAHRSGKGVAQDILRRLWPAYEAEYEVARAQIEEQNRLISYRAHVENMLVEIAGDGIRANDGVVLSPSGAEFRWRFCVNKQGRVDMNLFGLDAETAADVLSALMPLQSSLDQKR